jgi:hypothetical protein
MPDKRIDIFRLLENEGKLSKILIYPAVIVIDDPYEKSVTETFLNPTPIEALVQQISFESLRWKYFGQISQDSVQIICDLRYENSLKVADKIKIGDNFYKVYKDDSKGFMILKRTDYLICILERKNLNA